MTYIRSQEHNTPEEVLVYVETERSRTLELPLPSSGQDVNLIYVIDCQWQLALFTVRRQAGSCFRNVR
jgi:hypothetical protein